MRKTPLFAALTFLLLAACVTINIYFPAAAAEKAADRIIKDVWGEEKGQKPAKPQPAPQGALPFWLAIIPEAHAQADINISTPAIERLKAAMRARHKHLAPYYDSGAIGLTADGFIAIRNLKAIPLKERAKVKRWVAEENRDRKALYREIARANGHPEWEDDIRATFAKRWIANAKPGWWYQDEKGQWHRK